ncbi:DUF2782 domain-containing protein [Thermomonas paludicola]|uniref:DUF2782 domain-containing protein n=1 Tax=Thermomonas paludicola TaxID=2884874 RepID=UPI002115BFE4|nr:DUF2782 domain-containing protein [Thermomonas paludicola]
MRIALATALTLLLAACATATPESTLPKDAVPVTRTESNGDVITEYRVAGSLTMVKVTPARGVTYYIYDRNGDGIIDERDSKGGPMTYYKLFSW